MFRINTQGMTQGMTKTNLTNNCQKKASTEKIESARNHIYHYTNYLDVTEMKALINYLRTGTGKENLPQRISQQLPSLESLLHEETSYFRLGSPTTKEELANRLESDHNYINKDIELGRAGRLILFDYNNSLRSVNKQIDFTLFYYLKLYNENSDELPTNLKDTFDGNKGAAAKMYSEGKKIFEGFDNKDNGIIFTSRKKNDSRRWTIEDPQCQAISDNIFEL